MDPEVMVGVKYTPLGEFAITTGETVPHSTTRTWVVPDLKFAKYLGQEGFSLDLELYPVLIVRIAPCTVQQSVCLLKGVVNFGATPLAGYASMSPSLLKSIHPFNWPESAGGWQSVSVDVYCPQACCAAPTDKTDSQASVMDGWWDVLYLNVQLPLHTALDRHQKGENGQYAPHNTNHRTNDFVVLYSHDQCQEV